VVFVTGTGKSNYPVATPMGGFPRFTDEDLGRLHLLLYDLLYEGHEDTMRLP
jgi:hypothetical protein